MLMAPVAANKFIEALFLDQVPSCETEDHMWGLWGAPTGPEYQRLYWYDQKGWPGGARGGQDGQGSCDA